MSGSKKCTISPIRLPQKGIIELQDVKVSYDRSPVLDGVSLRVDEGDFIAITGPNGGGKTTLLRVILKLLKPSSGNVVYRFNGKNVDTLPIGYLPQKNTIDLRFPVTVNDVIASGLLSGFKQKITKENKAKIEEIIELVGVGDFRNKSIGELSGGQLQRTLLGRALISQPKVLVLDEPLSYVDKNFEHQIYSIIEELSKHTTIVLVSHEMSVIAGMANRHLIVDHGLHECSARQHYVPTSCR
ncbi:MAG: ABC transporter ATP-binding protein [Muribaculaceae bacterium]|nr:ABC transporter ATP-binding protein [Muribaculaceae bacterium]MBQ5697714.1 ABC transporter ATP-binding protein [Muribaculaceae bacterium]